MNDIAELLPHWKELGWLGLILVAVIRYGGKFLDRVLDWAGVNIKRHQDREDGLEAQLKAQGARLDEVESIVARFKEVVRVAHQIAHSAADGIDEECDKPQPDIPRIRFYSKQLRSIQSLDEVWNAVPATAPTPQAVPSAAPTST